MNKQIIEVPINVRYISEWGGFNTDLLKGHSIINKTITGCGFTHYCLTNNIPTILCSPRKFLLSNKNEQLPNTYLVINSGEKGVFIDNEEVVKVVDPVKELLKKSKKGIDKVLTGDYSEIKSMQDNIRSYILNCKFSKQAPKILVTYDSLKYVLGVIGEELPFYSVIVDEFQNIFIDASFKADTELNFINTLQDCPNVTYLSATPYIEEYLNELDEFKDLPYYELKWHPDRLHKVKIDLRQSNQIIREIDKIIQDYLEGRYPEKVDENGTIHKSREVVFYTNSVKLITSTIKRNNLTPDQVNIICADTEKNKKSLSSIKMSIGKAPLKGQSHKMFTFCTRTTYAGADFYSPSAMSVIISDCRIDSLSTDIRMDFPQIMGRQRLLENVFRDECIFIYKLSDKEVTLEEYDKLSKEKLSMSLSDVKNYEVLLSSDVDNVRVERMIKDLRLRIRVQKYSEDYTGINEKTGAPQINKLVYIAERRAFELRSDVYKSETLIYNEFGRISTDPFEFYQEKSEQIDRARQIFEINTQFHVKMKIVCDLLLDSKWYGHIHISDFHWLPLHYRNYLNLLGPEKIRSISHHEAAIRREIDNIKGGDIILSEFISKFTPGNRYTLKDIKEKVRDIYKKLEIPKSPKATDILDYFEVYEYLGYDKETGKRTRGYEIISLKD